MPMKHLKSINVDQGEERLYITNTEDIKEESGVPMSETEVQERKRLLICILVSLFAIQTVNMNVTTIVPNFCTDRHPSLNELKVSFIMV